MNNEPQPTGSALNTLKMQMIQESKARAIGASAAWPELEKAPEPLPEKKPEALDLDVPSEQPEADVNQQ